MKGKEAAYETLYVELEEHERNGVCILMDGYNASPMQVVRAHMARERGSYMRDYEVGPEGRLESLSFININRRRNRRNQPR